MTKSPETNEVVEVQQTHFYPFGGIIADISWGRDVQKRLFNGKELDASNSLYWYDYGARQYDATRCQFTGPDPLAEKYYEYNSYAYCHNSPINRIDVLGLTDFILLSGATKTIDDGSCAVFRAVNDGVHQFFQFDGYTDSPLGTKTINLTSLIQEQQIMNEENPNLKQNGGNTFCNYATQNILKALDGAIQTSTSVYLGGLANEMSKSLHNNTNLNFLRVNYEEARINAQEGGLSIVTYYNKKGHGHIATLSVGENIEKGEVANIGILEYSGFVSLNKAIAKTKTKEFFILLVNTLPQIEITNITKK